MLGEQSFQGVYVSMMWTSAVSFCLSVLQLSRMRSRRLTGPQVHFHVFAALATGLRSAYAYFRADFPTGPTTSAEHNLDFILDTFPVFFYTSAVVMYLMWWAQLYQNTKGAQISALETVRPLVIPASGVVYLIAIALYVIHWTMEPFAPIVDALTLSYLVILSLTVSVLFIVYRCCTAAPPDMQGESPSSSYENSLENSSLVYSEIKLDRLKRVGAVAWIAILTLLPRAGGLLAVSIRPSLLDDPGRVWAATFFLEWLPINLMLWSYRKVPRLYTPLGFGVPITGADFDNYASPLPASSQYTPPVPGPNPTLNWNTPVVGAQGR